MQHNHINIADLKQPFPPKDKPVRFVLRRFYMPGKRWRVRPFFTIKWYGGKVQKGWAEYGIQLSQLKQSSAYKYWAHDEGLARYKNLGRLKKLWAAYTRKREARRKYQEEYKAKTKALRARLDEAQTKREAFAKLTDVPVLKVKRTVPGVGLILEWKQPKSWKPDGYYLRYRSTVKNGWTEFGSKMVIKQHCYKGNVVVLNRHLTDQRPWHITVFATKDSLGEKQSNTITWKG